MLRLTHGALLLAVPLYVLVLQMIPAPASEPINASIPVVVGLIALLELSTAATIRSRKLGPAFDALRTNPNDAKALDLWRQGSLVSACCAMTVVLFGLVLHFLGASRLQVAAFFVVGTTAMLFWWPRRP